MDNSKIQHTPEHLRPILADLPDPLRDAYVEYAREKAMPRHFNLAIRPDDIVILRGHYYDPESGGRFYAAMGLHLAGAMEKLDQMADSAGWQREDTIDWCAEVDSDTMEATMAQDGLIEALAVSNQTRRHHPFLRDLPLLTDDEAESMISALEHLLPVLRRELAGECPDELHGPEHARTETIAALGALAGLCGSLADALEAEI